MLSFPRMDNPILTRKLQQRKLHRIQHFGRRDSKPMTSLFSYFDSGRERTYFTHLGPFCPASNNFFSTTWFVQLYKQFICVILLNSYLRSVACDWQSLVTGEKSRKVVALSRVVHRLTRSKETIKLLHRSGAGVSYDNVTNQTKSFSTEIQNNVNLAPKKYIKRTANSYHYR